MNGSRAQKKPAFLLLRSRRVPEPNVHHEPPFQPEPRAPHAKAVVPGADLSGDEVHLVDVGSGPEAAFSGEELYHFRRGERAHKHEAGRHARRFSSVHIKCA